MFHVLDEFVILPRSVKREESAACRFEERQMVPAEGGVISKEIQRIFQRVGEIIDENQKKNRDQNAPLRNSSLGQEEGIREFH